MRLNKVLNLFFIFVVVYTPKFEFEFFDTFRTLVWILRVFQFDLLKEWVRQISSSVRAEIMVMKLMSYHLPTYLPTE